MGSGTAGSQEIPGQKLPMETEMVEEKMGYIIEFDSA
jgi:hypothetical protein